jgi:tRNA(fMet)-specific endonuclease VapC
MKNRSEVVGRYRRNKPAGIAISAITASELYFGVYNSSKPIQNTENLANFLVGVATLNFDGAAALDYGKIRTTLKKRGTPIGELDMLIAAHARSMGLTLVTNNIREFERIENLAIEDWVDT